ncbi:MAG: DUF6691 family protein [Caulobacteraceae bacterium]
MKVLAALLCGLLFGTGLALGDMVNPARVLAFLNVAGRWDPTLAFVMAGALLPAAAGFWIARRRGRPLIAKSLHIPQTKTIDAKLVGGAASFGLGWGLVGLCPGPVFAALPFAGAPGLIFAVAMLCGMAAFRLTTLLGGSPQREPAAQRL